MAMVFVQHRVADFEVWKPLFEEDKDRRTGAGVRDVGVFRQAGDENMILVSFETDDPAGFMKMMGDPDLAAKMKEAGVISEPQAWIGEAAE